VIVVADSGPLISLSSVDLLDILAHQFDEVLLPDAVYTEVVERGAGRAGSSEVAHARWLTRTPAPPSGLVGLPTAEHLGPGEREAIAIALSRDTNLLCDDLAARRVAAHLGVSTIGTLAVLVQARSTGELPELAPVLLRLMANGFRISGPLLRHVLQQVGEPTPDEDR
jgi:hypothetical protein